MPRRLIALAVLLPALLVPVSALAADPGAQPGPYSGEVQGHYKLTFTVDARATSILGFRTSVVTYCTSGISPSGPTVKFVNLAKIKLAGSGRFDSTATTEKSGVTILTRVQGDLDGGRVSGGRLTYQLTGDGIECETDGAQPFSAKRN